MRLKENMVDEKKENTKEMIMKKEKRSHLLMHLKIQPPFLSSFPLIPPTFHQHPPPTFNSPYPSFPGHGAAQRIMGNEMAYLRLPKGEIEKERDNGRKRQSETKQRVRRRE